MLGLLLVGVHHAVRGRGVEVLAGGLDEIGPVRIEVDLAGIVVVVPVQVAPLVDAVGDPALDTRFTSA